MNGEAGILAQRIYLASTAFSLGCGAVLGFDAQLMGQIVGADAKTVMPLLLVFIGHQTEGAVSYDFRL